MANYPQELAKDAVCQSHTGHMTELWFLPARPLRLNTNEWTFPLCSNTAWCISLKKIYCLPLNSVLILFMCYHFDILFSTQLLRVFEMGNRRAVTVNIRISAVLWHQRCNKSKHEVLPKDRLSLADPHCVISQKTAVHISIVVAPRNVSWT